MALYEEGFDMKPYISLIHGAHDASLEREVLELQKSSKSFDCFILNIE